MYNIDETNSDVTFVVENNKVQLKIRNFDSTGTEVPHVITSSETTAESDTNVYSALRVKNELEALNVTDVGCTNNATVNEIVRELYLSGLSENVPYYISNIWNYNDNGTAKICVRVSDGTTTVAQVLAVPNDNGLYVVYSANNSNIKGIALLQFTLNDLPTTQTDLSATLHNDLVKNYLRSPIIKSYFDACISSYKGFLVNPAVTRSSILNELNQLSAIQWIRFWHNERYFTDKNVYYRGIIVRSGAVYLQLYDSDGNVHTITLPGSVPSGGIVEYKTEMNDGITSSNGTAIEETSCYLHLVLNYDVYDEQNSSNVDTLRIENHLLYDASWDAAFEDEIRENGEKALELANQLYHQTGIIYDVNSNPYKLSISNGEITASPVVYRNVLVIGNSIAVHGRATARGWYGYGYGMAASRASTTVGNSTDFVSHLKTALARRFNGANVSRVNMANWETSLLLSDFISDLGNVSLSGRDAIIFRLCENVTDLLFDSFYDALDKAVNYVKSQNATADIFLCGSCMVSYRIRQRGKIVRHYAVDKHIPYVDVQCEQAQLEKIGHYTEGFTNTSYTTVALYRITDAGVANHPNDLGHLHIANCLLDAMHYQRLEIEHSLTVVDSNSIGYDCATSWVENGIVNVKTSATTVTVSFTDNNNAVQQLTATSHGDGMFTFIMPAYDSIVTLY